MFDFLRNLTKSAEDKQQETVAAYLDGALGDRERQLFEQALAQDEALRTQVEQLRLVKQSLGRLPQRQVPRSFVLDPARYGRPVPQPWVQAYPVLRTATALAAFFFIFAVVAGMFSGFGGALPGSPAPAAETADEAAMAVTAVREGEFQAVEAEAVQVTRVVTEAESSAFEAEAVEEAPVELESEAAEESAAPEMGAAAESVEEEVEIAAEEIVEEEAEPLPAATQPASAGTAAPAEADLAEDDAGEAAYPAPAPETAVTVPLPTAVPTEPAVDVSEGDEAASDAAASDQAAGDGEIDVTAAAERPETPDRDEDIGLPTGNLPWLQVGLGLLLLLLAALTFYARGQR